MGLKGSTIATTGAITLGVSAAVYVLLGLWYMIAFATNLPAVADMMAWPVLFVLLGIVLFAVGTALAQYQDRKGTPYDHERRQRRR